MNSSHRSATEGLWEIFERHLASYIDGEIIDSEFFDDVFEDFSDSTLNSHRNGHFFASTYNAENRKELSKLLKLLSKIQDFETKATVWDLMDSDILPRPNAIDDEDRMLLKHVLELLNEPNLLSRLEPSIQETIEYLKIGKLNIAAKMLVEACVNAWTAITNKAPPTYISEYDHPFLKFTQDTLDYVLGKNNASARTYFK